jgi:hypothetical protein
MEVNKSCAETSRARLCVLKEVKEFDVKQSVNCVEEVTVAPRRQDSAYAFFCNRPSLRVIDLLQLPTNLVKQSALPSA